MINVIFGEYVHGLAGDERKQEVETIVVSFLGRINDGDFGTTRDEFQMEAWERVLAVLGKSE